MRKARKIRKLSCLMLASALLAGTTAVPQAATINFEEEADFEADLEIELTSASRDADTNFVVGNVTNTGGLSYRDVTVEVVFTDAEGEELAAVTEIIAGGEFLRPGDTVSFTIHTERDSRIASANAAVVDAVEGQGMDGRLPDVPEGEEAADDAVSPAVNTLLISASGWVVDRKDSDHVTFTTDIAVEPKGDYYLLTTADEIVVTDGAGQLYHYESVDDPAFEEKILGAYELHPADTEGLEFTFGTQETEKKTYESLGHSSFSLHLDVAETSGTPCIVFYEVFDNGIPVKEQSKILLDGTGTLSALISDKPLDYNKKMEIAIRSAKKLVADPDPSRFETGTVQVLKRDTSSFIKGSRDVRGEDSDTGILVYKTTVRGEEQIEKTFLLGGSGTMTGYADAGEDTDGLFTFEILAFYPVDIPLTYQYDNYGEFVAVDHTVKEVIEKYRDFLGFQEGDGETYFYYDINDYDIEGHDNSYGFGVLADINAMLGLPDSLVKEMEATTGDDGVQTRYYSDLTVSWIYDDMHGLEAYYQEG